MKKLLAIVLMSTMCINAQNQPQSSIKTYTPFFKTRPLAVVNQDLHVLCTAKEKENPKKPMPSAKPYDIGLIRLFVACIALLYDIDSTETSENPHIS